MVAEEVPKKLHKKELLAMGIISPMKQNRQPEENTAINTGMQ